MKACVIFEFLCGVAIGIQMCANELNPRANGSGIFVMCKAQCVAKSVCERNRTQVMKNFPTIIIGRCKGIGREENEMRDLVTAVTENLTFVLEILGVVAALFVVAYILEKLAQMKRGVKEPVLNTRKTVMVGVFAAISAVIMLFEFPVIWAPIFYKLDFSELPILIGAFAFGPVAGVLMEFIKILLNLCMNGTSTAFIGELANFSVGCSFILPASVLYRFGKTKKSAIWACVAGTIVITVFGTAFNAIYLIPAYEKALGLPIEKIIGMGMDANPLVQEGNIWSFVAACVAPLNLVKGIVVSVITLLVYKPLSPIIKNNR